MDWLKNKVLLGVLVPALLGSFGWIGERVYNTVEEAHNKETEAAYTTGYNECEKEYLKQNNETLRELVGNKLDGIFVADTTN